MKTKPNVSSQYINIQPSPKAVYLEEMKEYEFKNLDKIIQINICGDYAIDYLLLISIDKMISSLNTIDKVALIRSFHPKYPGIQIIIDGDIRIEKSLIPKFISWEKLENHQKSMEELLPIYEEF